MLKEVKSIKKKPAAPKERERKRKKKERERTNNYSIKLVDFIDLQLQVDKKVNGKISGSVSGLLVHRISWLLHGVGQPLTGNGHTERGCHGAPS